MNFEKEMEESEGASSRPINTLELEIVPPMKMNSSEQDSFTDNKDFQKKQSNEQLDSVEDLVKKQGNLVYYYSLNEQ